MYKQLVALEKLTEESSPVGMQDPSDLTRAWAPEEVKCFEDTRMVLDKLSPIPHVNTNAVLSQVLMAQLRKQPLHTYLSQFRVNSRNILPDVQSGWTGYEHSTILNVPSLLVFQYFFRQVLVASFEFENKFEAYALAQLVVWTLICFGRYPGWRALT